MMGTNLPGLAPLVPAFYRTPRESSRMVVMRAGRLTGYEVAEITGAGRDRPLCHVRWAVMLALRRRGLSLPQIGRVLGGRDHTTVIHGLERANALRASDADFDALFVAVAA